MDYVDYRCSISKYGSQVGLIEFSSPSQTHVEFSLGDNKSRWSVNNAIDRVGYDSGIVRFLYFFDRADLNSLFELFQMAILKTVRLYYGKQDMPTCFT